MSQVPPPGVIAEYYCEMDGLTFTFRAYQLPNGSFEGKFTVFEGAADFNAIYFGDDTDDGSSPSLGGPLNFNGRGDPDWDQAVQLSRPGLGPQGAAKPTYLSEGEYFTFPLDIDSLDEIQEIGVRATSTSTAEGSIKCILTPINEEHDDSHGEDDDSDELVATEVTVAQAEGQGDTHVEPPVVEEEESAPDDGEFYRQFAILIGELPEDAPLPEEEEEDADDFLCL